MGKINTILNRIYGDYLMPSRISEYEFLIKELSDKGYEHITFREYKNRFANNELGNKKYFINRHDIDTDISTAKKFFEIEKKYNAKASYYFRLSTLDYKFMKEIHEYGSEASYHFEEIAQYCKDNHIKSKKNALVDMDKIKKVFSKNLKMIEDKIDNFKISTVCSHGDFVNRKLGIVNNEITKDLELRRELEISCETYDKDIFNSFDIYIADKPYPKYYYPNSIFEYIGNKNVICMLSHPRQWRTNILVNTIDNMKRVYEGLRW